MASIYDEINQIKRDGIDNITYDDNGNIIANRGSMDDLKGRWNTQADLMSTFYGEPTAVGDMYPEEFGESKYDRQLPNWRSLYGRSLEDFRAEKQPWYSQLTNNLINAGTTTF